MVSETERRFRQEIAGWSRRSGDIITKFNGPHSKLIGTYFGGFEHFFLHLMKSDAAEFVVSVLRRDPSWVTQTHVYHCCTGPRGQIETATGTGTFTPPTVSQRAADLHHSAAATHALIPLRPWQKKTVFRRRLLMFWRFWDEMKGSERKERVDGTNRPK